MGQSLVLLAALAASATAQAPPGRGLPPAADSVLQHCIVAAKDEVHVAAEEAGLLVELTAKEGLQVRQGDLLAQINDSQPKLQKKLALIEQQAAQEQADNDINIRYAKAASLVAEAEYEQAIEANEKVSGTFPTSEVRRLKLAWHRAYLQIEQSKLEMRLAHLTASAREAQVEVADDTTHRRQIRSPIDGQVVSLGKQQGEWVNPGDPVLRIVRFDTLRIEGFVDSAELDPGEVAGRSVTVQVTLARGRTATLAGTIVYCSPLVQAGGEYRVWAEVTNRMENGFWLLRPGMIAEMTIHVRSAPATEQAASTKPR